MLNEVVVLYVLCIKINTQPKMHFADTNRKAKSKTLSLLGLLAKIKV